MALGARWKALDASEKAPWEAKAAEAKAAYAEAVEKARAAAALSDDADVSSGRGCFVRRAEARARAGSSYYQVIDGVKYDRKVLDDCRASVNDDGVIDYDEARRIVMDILDGPRDAEARGGVRRDGRRAGDARRTRT